MTPEEQVRAYLPLVDFLAEVVGPFSEVVLHDVRNKEHSLVAIRNGQLSGREVGAPMTDFASQVLTRGEHNGKDYISNYLGKAGSAGKFLKSSTYFIKDDDGTIIGMLGINTDLSPYWEVQRIMEHFLSLDEKIGGASASPGVPEERPSIGDMMKTVIAEALDAHAVDPSRMTTEEKKKIVEELDGKGVFLFKGAVAEVAQKLDVSEQTVYRYLKKF